MRSCLPVLRLLAVVASVALVGSAQYTVRRGDNLSGIAARHNVSTASLARANGLADPHRVLAGQRLTLPGSGAGATEHRVRSGETLWSLAARYGVSVGALARANNLSAPDRIVAGQGLTLPGSSAGGTTGHVVAAGETLSGIAARYGTQSSAIARANGLADRDHIRPGQRLAVPGAEAAVPDDPATDDDPGTDAVDAAEPTGASGTAAAGHAATNVPPPPSSPPSGPPARAAARADVGRMLEEVAREYGWSPAFVKGVAWQESGWQQDVVSSAGAIGIMQVLPSTGRFVSRHLVDRELDLDDPRDNIEAGVAFLNYLHQLTGGDPEMILGGYYQGLLSMDEDGIYPDTRRYTENVLLLRERFR